VLSRGLVLVNPRSGPDATDVDDLRAIFADHDVEECEPSAIAARVEVGVKEHRPFVAIAGGDGTIRSAAGALLESDVALLAIPAGTHNHFAKALGIASVEDAHAAADHGRVETIDVATCNESTFVNNSSIGLYPGLVGRREAHEHRFPKPVANAIAVAQQLRNGRRIVVEIDDRRRRAWLVFVGNGRYGEELTDIASRESLQDHVLDVRIVLADQRFARLRLVGALLLGRLGTSAVIERRACADVTIAVRGRARVDVALDGEVAPQTTPLRYQSRPSALRVVVPPPEE
jgi:undecaprenyl-diphosphatase